MTCLRSPSGFMTTGVPCFIAQSLSQSLTTNLESRMCVGWGFPPAGAPLRTFAPILVHTNVCAGRFFCVLFFQLTGMLVLSAPPRPTWNVLAGEAWCGENEALCLL